MPKKRGIPGVLGDVGGYAKDEWRPPNFAYVFQRIMETYGLSLRECGDLTLADIATLCAKMSPTVSEPDWFVTSVRTAKTVRQKLLALHRLHED